MSSDSNGGRAGVALCSGEAVFVCGDKAVIAKLLVSLSVLVP
jgi:hypothetical protein